MPPKLRVPFGLDGLTIYEPHQVPNGMACGCICPACKRPLIAKQRAKTPHFAHAPGEDCENGLETAVHLAAKQILADRREVRLPAVEFRSSYAKGRTTISSPEKIVSVDSVELESWLIDMRPDIVVKLGDQSYLVEIAVTHFVDEHKKAKIRRLKIPAFEIDVSSLKGGFTFSALTNLLFTAPYPATWLYNGHIDKMAAEAQASNLAAVDATETARRKVHQKRAETFKKYRELPAQKKLERNMHELGLNLPQMELFCTFVPWENSFGVPRNVWQSAVLVYIAKVEQHQGSGNYLPCQIDANSCLYWLHQVFSITPQVKDGDSIAVWKFFNHLERMGILRHLTRKEFDLMVRSEKWPLFALLDIVKK
jgi:hypothetical protein